MQRTANRTLPTAAILAIACGTAGAQVKYTIRDLGVLPGHIISHAHGVNNSGRVVGDSYDVVNNERRAFVFDDGVMKDLAPLPGGQFAWAYGINDWGEIAGESEMRVNSSSYYFATYNDGSPGSSPEALITLPQRNSRGSAINWSGDVAGVALHGYFKAPTATVWTTWGTGGPWNAVDLGGLMTDGGSAAFGLNDSGAVVGKARTFDGLSYWDHAFLYESGAMVDLGAFGGASVYSWASDVNDKRVVVGHSEGPNRVWTHAFKWKNGVMKDLGALPGGTNSYAYAINEAGKVVGSGNKNTLNGHAILCDKNGPHELTDLVYPLNHGWTLVEAKDISDTGFIIVGYGYPPGGQHLHAFRLRPLRFELPPPVLILDRPPLSAVL